MTIRFYLRVPISKEGKYIYLLSFWIKDLGLKRGEKDRKAVHSIGNKTYKDDYRELFGLQETFKRVKRKKVEKFMDLFGSNI